MGHVGSKSRSLGQIIEKLANTLEATNTGHNFCPIVLKLGQNVCLYKI